MKNRKRYMLEILLGIIFILAGLFLTKTVDNPQESLLAIAYVCVGLGCVIFGYGMGNFIANKTIHSDSEVEKQLEIDLKDERNIAIANSAKARGYDLMTYVFGALFIAFALMGVNIVPILLLLFAYLFVQVYALYCRAKFEKEM